MDWKYKHFTQEALFRASRASVLEAARAVMAESLGEIEDTPGGFVARGFGAWHAAIATFQVTPAPEGTKVAVELLVERAAMRGYMLFDVGGYYNGQIDKWFSGITQRLEGIPEQILVSKTTSNLKFQRGCLFGCLAYLVVGACLGIAAIALDRAFFPQFSASVSGPVTLVASAFGLLVGILAFLYVSNPEASTSKYLRAQLQRMQNREKK